MRMEIFEITPKVLSKNNFSEYGTAILKQKGKAPKYGKDWDCWFALGKMGNIDASVGVVQTRLSDEKIDAMEAHGKPEFLVPIDGPIIQPVAVLNKAEKPDARKVEAFIIYPGQSIVMKENIWHCAAIPLLSDSWYYFVGNSAWDGPGTSEKPWITFKDDMKIKILRN